MYVAGVIPSVWHSCKEKKIAIYEQFSTWMKNGIFFFPLVYTFVQLLIRLRFHITTIDITLKKFISNLDIQIILNI